MLTLGIETSCDETSCSLLEGPDRILSNIVSSSLFKHQAFGGVVPEIASRHCLEQIDFVLGQALEQAGRKREDIDLIAVTEGPGLIGSLLVGVCFAKALSFDLGIPLIGVNHLEAHLEACFITNKGSFEKPRKRKPDKFIGLLVSGGHTSLTAHSKKRVKLLGETVDDAVGEAYDKVAKILGLGYPGGPILDRLAREGNPNAYRFTKPKQNRPYDFSFSGIKTAVLYLVEKEKKKKMNENEWKLFQKNVAASFQFSVVEWLVSKTISATNAQKMTDIAVGGGVSANSHLRTRLKETADAHQMALWLPPLSLTGDNAAMIARQGYRSYQRGKRSSFKLSGNPNLAFI